MIALAAADGVTTSLVTNGTLLDRFGPELIRAGLRRLAVSLESMDEESFQAARRGASLHGVLGAFARFASAGAATGVKVGIVCALLPHTTIEQALDLARFAAAHGSGAPKFYPVYEARNGGGEATAWGLREMGLLNDELNKLFPGRVAPHLCREHHLLARSAAGAGYASMQCQEPWTTIVFHADGRINACNEAIFFRDASVEQDWRAPGWSLTQTWTGPSFRYLRESLRRGDPQGPCATCNACTIPLRRIDAA